MSRHDVVKTSCNSPAVSATVTPCAVDLPPESLLGLTLPDEINLINPRAHKPYPDTESLRRMKDANRLNCQMNPPAEKMNEVGATLVNYGGGYFRSWYIINGVVNYLEGCYDTQSRAVEAAEHARQIAQSC